jgi:amino acid transporter
LVIVVTSYRQTIFAYPSGGGSYIVSRENLGQLPSLVAGGALLVDYILTVAVSIAAGVAAILSLSTFSGLANHRVLVCVVLVAVITVANLRGMRQSGALFAVPAYTYIASLTLLVVYGLIRSYVGHVPPVPFDAKQFQGARQAGGTLGLFLLLRGFSSGAIALTGVEAISNGVPAFRRPESKNAATTLVWMATILGGLFFGVSLLAQRLHPYPSTHQTVLAEMAKAVYGGGPLTIVLQFATAAILTLAANTAYADFPRLASIMARDGFLPRQLAHRGDRLVFSNGILALAVAAALLLVAFGGVTNALIPLYAVGVFTAFTLSQTGMVRHHLRLREPGWRRRMAINGLGAASTLVVLVIIAATKFTEGAWLPILLVPLLVFGFRAIRRRYDRLDQAAAIDAGPRPEQRPDTVVVVFVRRVNRIAVRTVDYAQALKPSQLRAVHVADVDGDPPDLEQSWSEVFPNLTLDILPSPYRELIRPVEQYLDDLQTHNPEHAIIVVLPEIVSGHWYDLLLYNRTVEQLRDRVLQRPGIAVSSVPIRLNPDENP